MLKSSNSPLEVIDQNHSHLLHVLLPRLLYQLKGLRIAGDNLFEHLEGLARGVYGEGEADTGNSEINKSLSGTHHSDSASSSSSHSDNGDLTVDEFDDPSSSRHRPKPIPSWHDQTLAHLAREQALITEGKGKGIEEDLRVIRGVPVLECFLSEREREKLRKAGEGEEGRKRKWLGDFVNEGKMRQVRDSCLKIWGTFDLPFAAVLYGQAKLTRRLHNRGPPITPHHPPQLPLRASIQHPRADGSIRLPDIGGGARD